MDGPRHRWHVGDRVTLSARPPHISQALVRQDVIADDVPLELPDFGHGLLALRRTFLGRRLTIWVVSIRGHPTWWSNRVLAIRVFNGLPGGDLMVHVHLDEVLPVPVVG